MVLDALQMTNRDDAHIYLKEMFRFPDYYGENLDALYDCLCGVQFLYVRIENMTEDNMYTKRIIRVMKAAGATVEVEWKEKM